MILIEIIQWVLFTAMLVVIGMQLLITIAALWPPRQISNKQTGFQNSFLLVVHSRGRIDELSKTLYSISGITYPTSLYEVIIISEKPDQGLTEMARQFGISVYNTAPSLKDGLIERTISVFEECRELEEKYDAVVMVNAGSLISGNFLNSMNLQLGNACGMFQGCDLPMHSADNRPTVGIELIQKAITHTNMVGRFNLGLVIRFLGNGLCIRTNQIGKIAYELRHYSGNGMDLASILLMKENWIQFVPEAVVWSQLEKSKVWYDLTNLYEIALDELRNVTDNVRYAVKYFMLTRALRPSLSILSLPFPSFLLLLLASGGMALLSLLLWTGSFMAFKYVVMWLLLIFFLMIYCKLSILGLGNYSIKGCQEMSAL